MNFSIGSLFGTKIEFNILFIILVGFYALFGGLTAAVVVTLVFACILAHEFGHVLMARHFGIKCQRIIMLPIGGVALLDHKESAKNYRPKREFLIAVAGPAVTLATVAILGLLMLMGVQGEILKQVFTINIILFVFNLIPAYPMDGGRIFKSIVASICRNYKKAGRIAGITGLVMAAAMFLVFVSSGAIMGSLISLLVGKCAYDEYQENQ